MRKVKTSISFDPDVFDAAAKMMKKFHAPDFSTFINFVVRTHCRDSLDIVGEKIAYHNRMMMHFMDLKNDIQDVRSADNAIIDEE